MFCGQSHSAYANPDHVITRRAGMDTKVFFPGAAKRQI